MKESSITLCGHGSGTPSLKNMASYLTARNSVKSKVGGTKCVVAVRRPKITDAQRKKFVENYKKLLGRNLYSQGYRQYVFNTFKGKYYSDCSSSGCAALQKAGYDVPLLNTAGIYTSSKFETVKVEIKNGHIVNPEVLKLGDALLFKGDDKSRPLGIGHVEWVYKIDKEEKPKEDTKKYYPKYTGDSNSIVDALKSVGETKVSQADRQKIAKKNGIDIKTTTMTTINIKLLSLLKDGKLIK